MFSEGADSHLTQQEEHSVDLEIIYVNYMLIMMQILRKNEYANIKIFNKNIY